MSDKLRLRDGSVQMYDFCQAAKFRDPDYPMDITKEVRDVLKDVHPSMVIGFGALALRLYKIQYSYHTVRGNEKEGTKYLLLPPSDPTYALEEHFEREVMIEGILQESIKDYNRKFPYRAISNVEILEVSLIADANLAIG